ncbi:MAG: pyridoxal-phosphate dependent enzyme, partial [Planctomycetota bacterium]
MLWKKVPFHQMACYEAPSWARQLAFVPSHRVKLATLPTPIHEWRVPSSRVPRGVQLYVKRDDLTGCALSGTKVRRLEFQLARALRDGCRQVITCGYEQSNHIRATVVAARHLGLEPHVFVMSDHDRGAARCRSPGNWLLNMMCGARVTFVPGGSDFRGDVVPAMRRRADELRHPSLVIAQGGADLLGTFGSVECWREMLRQRVPERFDDVVVTCSSGGTVAGLALANHLTGCRVRIHA